MRTTYVFAAVISIAFMMSSCIKKSIKPSNNITMESRQHSGYDKIDVSDAMEVVLTMDAQESVVVEANENLHEYILTDVVGGTLKIRMKNNVRIKSGAAIKVYVSALAMNDIRVDGASRLELTNDLVTSNIKVDVSGASTFQGGFTAVDSEIDVSGASKVEIWGSTTNANVNISGASNLGDFAFTITDYLNIDLSGASKAELTVDGTMDIEASGASTFNYKGDGLIDNLNLSGASTVNKK